jgi:two-component system, chemotaxis family, chemotaxis protein CheY
MARVLIVDDDRDTVDLLGVLLTMDGHDVLLAADGEEALRLQRGWHADVIVVDMRMPRLDGAGTISELRGGFPNVKIIAISGDAGLLMDAKARGAQLGVMKPFDPSGLADAVRTLVESS